ncbi:MAG: radical SAM protein [Ruminococcus sp.]|nr:radical SAM protein [Ruminococcus sp.]
MICNLCPRKCNAHRSITSGSGFCKCTDQMKIARIAPHYWEEPLISGKNGCGAVFFSGCTLNCVYCQNYEISNENKGKYISPKELAKMLLELESTGVHTIEFVTATMYVDKLIETLKIYKPSVPLVYNSSGFEDVETLRKLEGYIDIYLPDFKYSDDKLAKRLSNCDNYSDIAKNAIKEMLRQQPKVEIGDNEIMQKGVLIRHLVLPSHTKNSIGVLNIIKDEFLDKALVSLMGQYVPYGKANEHSDINRKITKREYNKVLDELLRLELDGFAQELKAADKSYIPSWDF